MNIVPALSFALAVHAIASVSPAADHYLDVKRHESVALSVAQVKTILEEATRVLQDSNACDVTFHLRDNKTKKIATFSGPEDIMSLPDLRKVLKVRGDVKVVKQIFVCKGKIEGGQGGCTDTLSGSSVVSSVVDPAGAGVILAHERGHAAQILAHRSDKECRVEKALMCPSVSGDNRIINAAECARFKSSPFAGRPIRKPRLTTKLTPDKD